eukprot:Filipodium_phascolosomae@DN1591_c0_g1_i2.p1
MRKLGAAGVVRNRDREAAFTDFGNQLQATAQTSALEDYAVLKEKLEEFAINHKSRINSDPEFRNAFCSMCTSVGVDPLSSNRGLWTAALGVGTFYSNLAAREWRHLRNVRCFEEA